jgi:hypothetical protein
VNGGSETSERGKLAAQRGRRNTALALDALGLQRGYLVYTLPYQNKEGAKHALSFFDRPAKPLPAAALLCFRAVGGQDWPCKPLPKSSCSRWSRRASVRDLVEPPPADPDTWTTSTKKRDLERFSIAFYISTNKSRCLPLLPPLKEPEEDSVEVPLEELAEEVEDEDDEEPRRTRTSHGELSECLTMTGWMELAMFDFDCMGGMSWK